MRVEQQPAYLLYAQKISDSRLRVDCLTRDYGLMGFVARAPSRKKSPLLPFSFAEVSWLGKSGLKTMTNFEMVSCEPALTGNALYCGFYLNELTCRLLPKGEACEGIFELYARLLNRWRGSSLSLDVIEPGLREYELALLRELGYSVDFLHDVRGYEIEENLFYKLDVHSGFHPCDFNVKSQGCYAGEVILACANNEFAGAQRASVKNMTRQLLAPHLGKKPLKSREFFTKP